MSGTLNRKNGSNSRMLIKAYRNYGLCSKFILNGLKRLSQNQIKVKTRLIIQFKIGEAYLSPTTLPFKDLILGNTNNNIAMRKDPISNDIEVQRSGVPWNTKTYKFVTKEKK